MTTFEKLDICKGCGEERIFVDENGLCEDCAVPDPATLQPYGEQVFIHEVDVE